MRYVVVSVLAMLVGCATPREAAHDSGTTHAIATSFETLADGAVCQIGPDDGPVAPAAHDSTTSPAPRPAEPRHTDRGIGGTGAPVTDSGLAGTQLAERGIGGTGIGGTGIVGVITGFASICVDGMEVAYDNAAAVDIDGTSSASSALRAGQVVMIQAKGSIATPVAQAISVRRQVIGRIESVELATRTLTVAGQSISVPAAVWSAGAIRLGNWVAVSGLRRSDGVLIATRLDPAPVGTMIVRGQVVREGDIASIGDLILNGPEANELRAGQSVMVSGQYLGDRPQVRLVTQDALFGDPAGYFSNEVNHLVLQAYVRVAAGAIYLNGLRLASDLAINGKPEADRLAIVSLERKPDGSFAAVGLHYADNGGSAPGATRAPAAISRAFISSRPRSQPSMIPMAAADGLSPSARLSMSTALMTNMPGGINPAVATTLAEPVRNGSTTTVMLPVSVNDAPLTNRAFPSAVDGEPRPTPLTPPVASGSGIDSIGDTMSPHDGSRLISGLTAPTRMIKRPLHHAGASRSATVATANHSATVSLATEAVAAPTAQFGPQSARTATLSAPPSSGSGGSSATDSQRRKVATGGAAPQGH